VRRLFALAALAAAATLAACGGQPGGPLSVQLTTPAPPAPAFVSVSGLSSGELRALFAGATAPAGFDVRVEGAPDTTPSVAGTWQSAEGAARFTPRFPFEPGRRYVVTVDPTALPGRNGEAAVRTVVGLPALAPTAPTTVTRVWPSATTVPENLLRMYLEFSGPMAREHGRSFLTLVELVGGREVEVSDAFLALDVDFWSPDATRYTVFLDPGRVKRGILPNDKFGRALKPGHRYRLKVDPAWRDASGRPLSAPFAHEFTVGAADMRPLSTSAWRVTAPRAGSSDAVSVTFSHALDHGLLQRALGVARAGSTEPLSGRIEVADGETTWRFVPATPWSPGEYYLVVLSILEDPMGNKLGRPFDVDRFDKVDERPAERTTVRFLVK
jgi:hypothetical protein